MAQRNPSIEFEDIPLDNARRMSRGPRMDPELDLARKQNIQLLDNTATCMPLPERRSPTRIKHRIVRRCQ
jgi:hypothetical protein